MKIHYLTIGLIVAFFLFLGCTQNPQNNLPTTSSGDISSEVDSGWINETEMNSEDMIATDADAISSEATPLDENQTINVGEMIN